MPHAFGSTVPRACSGPSSILGRMESILLEILEKLRAGERVDERALKAVLHAHDKLLAPGEKHFSKKALLPFYLRVKEREPERWRAWGVTPELERALVRALRMKPRRTASGVATITVITKPWPCSSNCLYCPCDVRMPKSYLADEPACQRAERACFDPYLQVSARLQALTQMGHPTDKVELIVLGGTWSDYPCAYQIWFVAELFRALNDGVAADGTALAEACRERRSAYERAGIVSTEEACAERAAAAQRAVTAGALSYNEAVRELYGAQSGWADVAAWQCADLEVLLARHRVNETARHRVVGLVIETRPDLITPESLTLMRRLGCTKVQMGVQSLDPQVLAANRRATTPAEIGRAFALLRAFGFKIHVHFMANLLGASPEADKRDYARLVTDPAYLPDEVKLYPCALVDGTGLVAHWRDGSWRPYTEDELMDVLVADVLATPAYVRISRMIRDISSGDIMTGNKKTNLRQMVEARIEKDAEPRASGREGQAAACGSPRAASASRVQEIREREISLAEVDVSALELADVAYETAVSREHFLQWVTPEGRIAGFLRLSLPRECAMRALFEGAADLRPQRPGEAMIREVHVYGAAARISATGSGVQHLGLGRALVERACEIARAAGCERVNVISSVGTRGYYRGLGFERFSPEGLYQQRDL